MKRKLMALILGAVMTVSLAACGSSAKAQIRADQRIQHHQ